MPLMFLLAAALPSLSATAAPEARVVRQPPAAAKVPVDKPAATTQPATTRASKLDASLPTQDDIRKAFEAKQYAKVIADVGRVLPVRRETAVGYDRYELLMLKGESHLQLKQAKSAGDAFTAAAKETRDEIKAATARATQRMLRESKGLTAQRRHSASASSTGGGASATAAGPASVDLLDREKREDALRLTYDNLRDAAEPKVKEATRSRTLPPILDALTALSDIRDLELAATGGDSSTASARQELGERARSLMSKELDRTEGDIKLMFESANNVVTTRTTAVTSITTGAGYDQTKVYRRGLSAKDRTDLKAAMKTCQQIMAAAETITRQSALDSKAADELVGRAKKIGQAADRALTTTY
jgi:hypothetical protein